MKREMELTLIRQCLSAKTGQPQESAVESAVAVAHYTDPERFERERELLRRVPHLVAHGSELPDDGDFVTRTVMGTPVLLVRDGGRVGAFLNVCRHRGMTLERNEGGQCKRFVCPYHAWTYGLDGSLDGVRQEQGFPSLNRAALGLVPLPCVERAGFIFVTPSRDGQSDVDDASAALLAEIAGFGSGETRVFSKSNKIWKANWKLITDGGLESYHFWWNVCPLRAKHRESNSA